MTEAARDLVLAFESLSPEDQQQVVAEIPRRSSGAGDFPVAALDELAVELFRCYDAEEAARA